MALGLAWLSLTPRAAFSAEANTFEQDGWIARCDASVCRASLASDARTEALLLGSWSGTNGIAIGIATPHGIADRERPIDARVDDKPLLTLQVGRDYAPLERVDTFWLIEPRAASALLQALQTGKRLRISYLDMLGSPHDADFGVEAMAKVAAFFDLQQHLSRVPVTGIAPPSTVARAPDVSRIDLIIRMGVPDRLLQRHARASDCEDPNSPRLKSISPVIGPLSKVAILYAIPCAASGTEISYRLWVIETGEIGGITPLYFALFDPTFGWKGSDLLYNVTFEPAGSRLTSASKASSGNTCGHRATWHWKNWAFALDEFQLAKDCPAVQKTKIYPPN